MDYNARIVTIDDSLQANSALSRIGCDSKGIHIMMNKAVFKVIKLEGVSAKDANLLKQTFLAKGGEVAVARGTANLSIEATEVMIFATLKQYKLALAQLRLQPWGLPRIAKAIEKVLGFAEEFPEREYSKGHKRWQIKSGRTLVMGILNITPDSFSDGGRYNRHDAALRHVEEMIRDGADIIDIGAESTRPYNGAEKISAQEEIDRLLPILEKVVQIASVPVSVDTYKAGVALEAIKVGANIINDIWGLQGDPDMAGVIAENDVPVIIMHNQDTTVYNRDILSHLCEFLRKSMEIGSAAGIKDYNFIVDPGIGFGKTPAQNLLVMSRLEELRSLGCPILLGTSRKRFIGEVLNLPVNERMEGTGATVAIGISKGANIVRVHDVKEISRIAKMTDAMIGSGKYE